MKRENFKLEKFMIRKTLFLLVVSLFLMTETFAGELQIIDKPILWSDFREQLIREYAATHYNLEQIDIIPKAVVVHWTASGTWESAYNHFYHEARADGTLNVASHFLVSRDGKIYRLTPETALNRHIIGYNWCAIGIENVGGVNGVEDLTDAQLEANVELIKYLHKKYATISYVFGHYQQDAARSSGLYIENVPNYRSEKIDPGYNFMTALKNRLQGEGLIFYDN